MEENKTRHLALVLKVLVTIAFVCNLVALPLLPGIVGCSLAHIRPEYIVEGGDFFFEYASGGHWLVFYGLLFWESYVTVWQDAHTAVLTVFLFACGCCTAVILAQAGKILDTLLEGEIFVRSNARHMRRAAVCCFVISGAALVRLLWGFWYYGGIGPLFTYNALFIPIFLMGGLLFLVMSALFLQAACLKEENDLTI